jgi:hypothetical protein
LVDIYSIGRFATLLAKNVSSSMFDEQLLTNFSTIFVIHVLDVVASERLVDLSTINTLKGMMLQ